MNKLMLSEVSGSKGFLTITKVYADNTEEVVLDREPNAITFNSKREHLKFLRDITAKPDVLQSFKIGIGGTVDPDGKRPIKPDPTRNDLYQPLVIQHNDITIVPSPENINQVYITVIFSLNQDEANDEHIDEVALFKASGNMFNIKTFRSIPKTESFSLKFEWRIIYA